MTLRRDARRNRARILAAAVDVFRQDGVRAPLEQVARRAGVGRGTLYRHFPDRAALVATLFERRVDALERHAAAAPGPTLLEQLLVEVWRFQAELPGVVTASGATPGARARLEDVVGRTRTLLGDALAHAHAGGTVRAAVTLDDVYVTLAMIDGVASVLGARDVPLDAGRGFALALRTLRSPDRLDLPVPTPQVALAPDDDQT